MANSFICKAIFGLGVTSVADFVRLMSKYKTVKDEGIDYINASSFTLPKNKNLLVFDSVKELFRFNTQIKKNMVIVISDTPVILKEIPDLIPLDYNNDRSFEFNFIEVDPHLVMRMLRNSKQSITSKFVGFDNLGYHVNRIKGTGELINAYLSVTSSMPYDKRSQLREAVVKFFAAKKPNVTVITDSIDKIGKNYIFSSDIDNFEKQLNLQFKSYHDAVNSPDASAIAAKKFEVEPYAVSYFRKLNNQKVINDERLRKNNVQFKSQTARIS